MLWLLFLRQSLLAFSLPFWPESCIPNSFENRVAVECWFPKLCDPKTTRHELIFWSASHSSSLLISFLYYCGRNPNLTSLLQYLDVQGFQKTFSGRLKELPLYCSRSQICVSPSDTCTLFYEIPSLAPPELPPRWRQRSPQLRRVLVSQERKPFCWC